MADARPDFQKKPWQHFHSPPRRGRKEKILHDVFGNTRYKGSYITDLLKNHNDSKSISAHEEAERRLNRGEAYKDAESIKKEFAILEKDKKVEMIYIFGIAASNYWEKLRKQHLDFGLKEYEYKRITHFSSYGENGFKQKIYTELPDLLVQV